MRGLKSKVKDIISLTKEKEIDILVFTETKLSDKENRRIDGYKNHRLNRQTRAGGVIVYYKEDLDVKLVKKNKECETVWIKICGEEDLVLGGVYSPCEDNVSTKEISEFVRELEKDYAEIRNNITDNIMMVGDFNAHVGNDEDGIAGNNERIGRNGHEYRRFIKERRLILGNNTCKCFGKWTRVEGEKKSILDLTLTSSTSFERIESILIDEDGDYSIESKRAKTDHNFSIIKMKLETNRAQEREKEIIICNEKWDEYRSALKKELEVFDDDDVKYTQVESAIQKASRAVISRKFKKPRKRIWGYNEEIQAEIKERRKRCSQWKKEKDPVKKILLEQNYREQKLKVNEILDLAESEEISRIIEKDGTERLDFWKTMKRIRKKEINTIKIRKENKELTEDPNEILEEKKKYFQKLYSKPKQTAAQEQEEIKLKREIKDGFTKGNDLEINQKITTKELDDSVARSKRNKVPGPDLITNDMMKEGIDICRNKICTSFNNIKENLEDFPSSWELGDLISFFKGKGDPYDLGCQRGITLTSAVLKILENIIGHRIEPLISQNSTPLQGGGKKGESPEEYIFAIQTIIDSNKAKRKPTKLIITDVEKAFDQAWRVGIFKNLMNRGVTGELLELIWKINDHAKSQIKENSITHSDEFIAEESIRQGGGLSAILYGQHVSSVVEDLEQQEMGPIIGEIHVPAIAWQDDVTLVPDGKDEEKRMINLFEDSTDRQRITLAVEKKTKSLLVGKEDYDITVIKGKAIDDVKSAKVLGYIFNDKGNPESHLEAKESETISMMANMGLSLKENNMDRIYLNSLLIIYEKCFVRKLLYGLAGIALNAEQLEKVETIDRKVIRNFLNLPTSTPKCSLYNELGIVPIRFMLWKRKLGMWWRINQETANPLIQNCRREQINKSLPWIHELANISVELGIDLNSAKKLPKQSWKDEVKRKIKIKAQEYIEKEMEENKRYDHNMKNGLVLGKRKRYINLTQKKAKIWFRMRADIIDPAPRQPYSPLGKWKCKFCPAREQGTEHYVKNCPGTAQCFEGYNRGDIYNFVQRIDGNDQYFYQATKILENVYKLINEE